MVTKLIVASGKSAGRSISLKQSKLLIGRSEECDVRPLSDEVSRRHCAVFIGPDDTWIEDLRSRNGTYVNGKRIDSASRMKLADGDMIRVGSLELRVSCQAPNRTPGSESAVSRWLGEGSAVVGSETGATGTANEDGSTVGLGFESMAPIQGGPSPAQKNPSGADQSTAMLRLKNLDEVREAAEQSGILQHHTKKPAESSRDAAAEALKKFFERK